MSLNINNKTTNIYFKLNEKKEIKEGGIGVLRESFPFLEISLRPFLTPLYLSNANACD